MKVSVFLTILSSVTSALAGCNCKCQDPSGTGPQWDDLTYEACSVQLPDESAACLMNKVYHGQEHHQCSSSTCCIDSGGFDKFCKGRGAPGAFCWK